MPRIFRIWLDIDEYDPATDQWMDVPADFGPTATFVSVDDTEDARLQARAEVLAYAEQLHRHHLITEEQPAGQDVPA